jgi:hypothetical protein
MELHSTLSDILFGACDSYLDVVSCKDYTSSIFRHVDCSDGTVVDSREDDSSVEHIRCVETMRSQDADERPSLSPFLMPLLPISYLTRVNKSNQVRKRATLQEANDIFRAKNRDTIVSAAETTEYSEFCKLCRCTAWSQDSNNSYSDTSIIASPVPVDPVQSQASLIHWDAIIGDSWEIRSRSLEADRED